MSMSLLQEPVQSYEDANGRPLNGGRLFTYAAGTLTPKATYQDADGSIPNTNPIILNERGEAVVYGSGNYRMILKNAAGATIWDRDNITSPDSIGQSILDDLADSEDEDKGDALVAVKQPLTGAIARTQHDKNRELVTVTDFVNADAAMNSANAIDTIVVPLGGTTKPASLPGKNLLWDYTSGGDSRNVVNSAGDRGGLFSDYDCKANRIMVAQIREDQSSIAGGGYRDLLFLNIVDNDTSNYQSQNRQKVTQALRAYTQGAYNGSAYVAQYKDLVGAHIASIGNIQWNDRGVSGLAVDAYQMGIGIASNEFAVHNPDTASGGVSHSMSMAAVQAIVRSRFADEDDTHKARGVYVTNNGKRITSGVEIYSNQVEGFQSAYRFGIDMRAAVISEAAIYMPFSASGATGTVIAYDSGDFTSFDRANNRFLFAINNVSRAAITENGLHLDTTVATATTRLFIGPSTAGLSQLRFFPGGTPTDPQEGDVWNDGSLRMRIGGVTKTFAFS